MRVVLQFFLILLLWVATLLVDNNNKVGSIQSTSDVFYTIFVVSHIGVNSKMRVADELLTVVK